MLQTFINSKCLPFTNIVTNGVFFQMNLKLAGLGVIVTFVATLLATLFVPMIASNLLQMKTTAPDVSTNSTIDSMVKIVYLFPLGIIIGGFVGSFAVGVFGK